MANKLRFNDLTPGRDTPKIQKAIQRVVESGNFILGSEVAGFEKEFARYLGSKYCIGVASGMEALQIALMSLGIGHGDEVITTPVSAIASTFAIMATGATPVFVDVDKNGLIDTSLIEKVITKKTKAILPVHLYGNPADISEIGAICQRYQLFFIEDACQAHGSSYKSVKLGTIGDIGCLSFYPTKNLGSYGDAGAIVTNSAELANICRKLRNYGGDRFGLNSRLDELQAAVLRVKLKHLDIDNKKRKQLANRYISNLSDIIGLDIVDSVCHPERSEGSQDLKSRDSSQTRNDSTESNFHLLVIKIKKRDSLKKHLENKGIEVLVHYPKIIPDHSVFKGKYANKFLRSREFVRQILSLPCHPQMSLQQVNFVCSEIKAFFAH